MTEELRQMFEHAEQLPEELQRELAEMVRAKLVELEALAEEEREWDAIVSSPRGQAVLARLADEAFEEIARGDVEEGGWE